MDMSYAKYFLLSLKYGPGSLVFNSLIPVTEFLFIFSTSVLILVFYEVFRHHIILKSVSTVAAIFCAVLILSCSIPFYSSATRNKMSDILASKKFTLQVPSDQKRQVRLLTPSHDMDNPGTSFLFNIQYLGDKGDYSFLKSGHTLLEVPKIFVVKQLYQEVKSLGSHSMEWKKSSDISLSHSAQRDFEELH